MKVLFLFSGSRAGLIEKIDQGEYHGGGFWGMIQLPSFGVSAQYLEVEQVFPGWFASLIRKYIHIYAIHLTFFWKFFLYDVVFTSGAFFSQLFFTLVSPKRPLWVMHDFSIKSLLGDETTMRQKVFAFMVSRSAGIVTLSQDETTFLKKRFPHMNTKIEMIPFGVDLNFFKSSGLSVKNQILAVGFDPDRDWKTLLLAVDGLDVDVVLATRPTRVEKFLPLPERVVIKQFSPRELVAEYEKSAVVVIPLDTSYGVNDAMGCSTLFEAMAMSKPIIATRTKAMETYIVNGDNGLLFEAGDHLDLRSKITSVLSSPELRQSLGGHAYDYACKNLDINVCGEQLANFLKSLLNGR